MTEVQLMDAIVQKLMELKAQEIEGYLSIDGPIEWDSIPKDEDSLVRIIQWFYQYKRGIICALGGAEWTLGGDSGAGVIADYQVKPTISTVCIYDRIRSPKEGTLAVLDMAALVKSKLAGQDLGLPILPLYIQNEYEVFSTAEAIAWAIDWGTEYNYQI